MQFNELHRLFEKNDTDLHTLQKEENFSRYLLVRSLDSHHLMELLEKNGIQKSESNKTVLLYEKIFNSDVSEDDLIDYIKCKYPEVRDERLEQEIHLPEIIKEYGEVKCGVRNDNLNDTAKQLVRDKSIRTKQDLEIKVDKLLQGTIKGYILWQYYNQVTNDLVEHIFNNHANVIPTLRKIKYVDFMVKIDDKIIPFDLKITHISDEFFDLFTKGISESSGGDDSFSIGENASEIEIIKNHYKKYKKSYNLPNFGGLKKDELIKILLEKSPDVSNDFVNDFFKNRRDLVNKLSKHLKKVEWWNYKFQGERLFKNNNRFFVFLAYKDSLEDARPLKGNLEEISKHVTEKLNDISSGNLNEIKYYYTKDKGLEGAYIVNSVSVLVTD
ncbi:hypothetical protein [Pantoea sp.]|uniref:hypothetical protein n=1 Tax=Pantoea sp. TaxID=69393 RepID=UPI0028AFDC24|nr:hypothetical protein [Pantoea sp.]